MSFHNLRQILLKGLFQHRDFKKGENRKGLKKIWWLNKRRALHPPIAF
jgi:hypothetical protein